MNYRDLNSKIWELSGVRISAATHNSYNVGSCPKARREMKLTHGIFDKRLIHSQR